MLENEGMTDQLRKRLFEGWPGCSNHGCVVTGPRTGMGTNGRCSCLQNASRSQLGMLQSKIEALLTPSNGVDVGRTDLCKSKAGQIGSVVGLLVQSKSGPFAVVHDLGRVSWISEDVS